MCAYGYEIRGQKSSKRKMTKQGVLFMKQMVNLKRFRQKMNITQAAAAEKIGIDQRQWNRYENGINELPIRYLIAICNAFNISADWLLETEYSDWEGDTVGSAIEDFYEEAVATIRGAEYLADNRDNLLDFIYFNLARDREKMLRKYKLQNQEK